MDSTYREQDRGYATPCWVWQGPLNEHGYGLSSRTDRLAHRAVYRRLVGAVPQEMTLDHLCRIRACVNPDHLEVVTLAENTRRGAAARYAEREGPLHPLVSLRIAKRLSQTDLAYLLGCSQGLVALWERGEQGITPEWGTRLRELFGVHPLFDCGETRAAKRARAHELRREGLTQVQIAARLSVSDATVCRWLRLDPFAQDDRGEQRRAA